MAHLLTERMLIKDITIKSLVTGDKSAWIKLETLYPETIERLKELIGKDEVVVTISEEE